MCPARTLHTSHVTCSHYLPLSADHPLTSDKPQAEDASSTEVYVNGNKMLCSINAPALPQDQPVMVTAWRPQTEERPFNWQGQTHLGHYCGTVSMEGKPGDMNTAQ